MAAHVARWIGVPLVGAITSDGVIVLWAGFLFSGDLRVSAEGCGRVRPFVVSLS